MSQINFEKKKLVSEVKSNYLFFEPKFI